MSIPSSFSKGHEALGGSSFFVDTTGESFFLFFFAISFFLFFCLAGWAAGIPRAFFLFSAQVHHGFFFLFFSLRADFFIFRLTTAGRFFSLFPIMCGRSLRPPLFFLIFGIMGDVHFPSFGSSWGEVSPSLFFFSLLSNDVTVFPERPSLFPSARVSKIRPPFFFFPSFFFALLGWS